jgi:hypothetical protein
MFNHITSLFADENKLQRTEQMTYNPKTERSRRQERRDKRIRPEKKNLPMNPVKPMHPTKPKNHNKIAELKASRGQHIKEDIDCSELEFDVEFGRLEMVALWHHLYGLIKPRCWPYIVECEHDDGTFSIYTDGWPY